MSRPLGKACQAFLFLSPVRAGEQLGCDRQGDSLFSTCTQGEGTLELPWESCPV